MLITNGYQKHDEHTLGRVFSGSLKNYAEPSTRETIGNAKPYLDYTFEGEAILSIGKAVDFTRKGVGGIINVMPFTCMPGTIVNSLLKKLRELERSVPVLNMAYAYNGDAYDDNRLLDCSPRQGGGGRRSNLERPRSGRCLAGVWASARGRQDRPRRRLS